MPASRRAVLAGSALAGTALAAPAFLLGRTAAPPAYAAPPAAARQAPAYYRFRVGSTVLTSVYDGFYARAIDARFVRNASFTDVQRALGEAFMAPDTLEIPITPLVVQTSAGLVMIDTGSGGQLGETAGSLPSNLAAAGFDPKAIGTILISNFHPDHINGLRTKDNELTFPNAEIRVSQAEWAFWMSEDNFKRAAGDAVTTTQFLNAKRVFGGLRERVKPFAPDQEVAPGITAIDAPGHTPGHCAFAIASGKDAFMAMCDITNHPWLFARHPDWQPRVDMDGPLAVKTRLRLLDRISSDRMPIQGYHFPFPGYGHIAKSGTGYEFVPAMWQTAL